jgi:hypothetical protein
MSRRAVTITWISTTAAVAIALLSTFFRAGPELGSDGFDIDPIFGIPKPPLDTPYYHKANIIEISLMTLCGLIGVVMGAYDAYHQKSLLPLMLPISGAFIAFPETFLDNMGALYYPWSSENRSFHVLGREMPPWIPIWFGYGAFMQYNLKLLHNNCRTKTLWIWWAITVVGDLVIEEILLPMGIYRYYGNQPLIILGTLPWWWLPCNSVGVFLATALAHRYEKYLRDWKSVVVIFSTPMCVGATYGFIAFPSWVAVNSNYPWLVTQLLGLATMIFGVVMFCIVLEMVLGRHPFIPYARAENDKNID